MRAAQARAEQAERQLAAASAQTNRTSAAQSEEIRKREEALKRELQDVAAAQARMASEREDLARRAASLAQKEQEIATLTAALDEKRRDNATIEDRLARLERVTAKGAAPAPASAAARPPRPTLVASAEPVIRLIQPKPGELTRGENTIIAEGASGPQDITAAIISAIEIQSVTVNGERVPLNEGPSGPNGRTWVFTRSIRLTPVGTPVKITAIDRLTNKGEYSFVLKPNPALLNAAPLRVSASDLSLGRTHALLIGNWSYRAGEWPALITPQRDVAKLAEQLEKNFGMQVQTLPNATREQISRALYAYTQSLTPDDSLVIFYAGHGKMDERNRTGYWIGVNGGATDRTDWYSNEDLERVIGEMRARKVLVISDSCYSASMASGSVPALGGDASASERLQLLKATARSRSRMLMSSGGFELVQDGMGQGRPTINSPFAAKLIEALNDMRDPFTAGEMFARIQPQVVQATRGRQDMNEQTPQFKIMSGHEGGDFIFLPNP